MGLGPLALSPAVAGNNVGSFEIEGNTKDDTGAGEPLDWATASPTITVTNFTDASGNGDDSFGMGSKQEDPATWNCINSSSPGKSDITGGAVGFRTINGKQYAYVNFTRKATEGSADIDFEFNKSKTANPACPSLPLRSVGDLVIAFDADNGGKNIMVRVFEWNGSTFVLSTTVPLSSKGTLWDGATNGDGSNKTGNFGEAVLNLSDTIGDVTCGEFSTVFMKSRSSTEINSALQDRTSTKPVQTGACPDSNLTKTVKNVTTGQGPATTVAASSGNTLEYTLKYENKGPVAANSVVVTDTIQGNQSYVANSCTPSTSCSFDGSKITWNLGNVAAGGSVSMTFRTTLGTFTASGSVKNIGSVDTAQEEPKNSNETTVNVTAVPVTDGVKSVRNVTTGGDFGPNAAASPGDTLEYRIVVSNTGNGPATGVVKDTITGNQSYVANSCAGGTSCSFTSPTITWNIGTVAAGGSVTLTFKTTLGTTFPAGTTQVKNTAVVDTDQEPEKPTNETTTNVSAAATTSGNKDVRNVTTGGSFGNTATASPGDTLEYRIVVTNTGNATATGVTVTDEVKAFQTYVANSCTGGSSCSFTSPNVSWTIASIAPGAANAVTLTFRVTLATTFPPGTTAVKNVAVVDSNEEPPHNTDETTTTVTASPNLDNGVKSVRNVTTNGTFAPTATASPGNVLEYQIKVTNNGNAAATNVVITDSIQSKQTYVANSCTGAPCSFSSPTVTWNVGALAAGASVTVTFRVTLDGVFPAGTTEVKNTAVNDSDQEGPKTSNETKVTVTASPNLDTSAKSVKNVTTNGSYGSSATASPGDTIEYRVVVTNTGNAPATGVVVTDAIAAGQTYVAGSCAGSPCSFTSPTVTWTVGTVNPGSPVTLTFRVTMTGPFNAGSNTISNTASIDSDQQTPKNTNTTTVTVTGTSNLTIGKAADKTSVVGGDTITYTLTYGNTGNAAATGTTIVETVPDGTTYVSCTGGCTFDGTTVTWTIGSVAPGQGPAGTVTMTVKVNDTVDQCTICNVAQIKSPVQNSGTAVNSNQVCVNATPQSDPSTAKANGDAMGLKVYAPLLGIPLVNTEISKAASSQTGVGAASDDDAFLNLFTGALAGLNVVAKADVLTTTSDSRVTKAEGARQTSTAQVLGLNLVGGLVTADVIRSVASTTARGDGSSNSAAGTTFTNLKVLGSSVVNPSPGLRIPLDGNTVNRLLYGRGSYVAINDQVGSTSGPASGQTSGGVYKADLTVTAIRVYITGGTVGGLLTLGGPPVEITVAKATAHSEHKQTRLCGTVANRSVSGHAFIASAQVDGILDTSYVERVEIPASGGHAEKLVPAAVLPSDGNLANAEAVASVSDGTVGATSSTSSSYAQAAHVCVLRVAGTCTITADAIRSQSNSTATSGSRSSNATGTTFVNLKIAGTPVINGTPAANTVIPIPGIGFVILNEQVFDGPETGHTGLTVRALRVVVDPRFPILDLIGAEVIVAEAHSDATWR